MIATLAAFAELQGAVAREWNQLHGLLPDQLAIDMLNQWAEKMRRIDNPPPAPEAAAGFLQANHAPLTSRRESRWAM